MPQAKGGKSAVSTDLALPAIAARRTRSEPAPQYASKAESGFRDPLSEAEPGMTTFLGISGDAGIFPEDREGVRIAEIIDGTSNTLMVIKGPEESAIEWTRPSDLTPDMNLLDQFFGELEESFLGLTADGAVHTFDRDTDEAMIRALITRGGREVIEW